MKVLLLGATGMVGQGVMRECLADPAVSTLVLVGRRPTGQRDPKVREMIVDDLADLSPIEPQLAGLDACFFCVGVSAAGMSEARYTQLTYDLTLSVAQTLVRLSPGLIFVYVSGVGTDSSERGRVMWARVKGRTENALLQLQFKAAYMFRPGVIIPGSGIRSSTPLYRFFYTVATPLFPLIKRLFPENVTTTEQVGRAMIGVARRGYSSRVLEPRDINAV